MSWATWDLPEPPFMNDKFGITAGKKILNQLHYQLGVTGFSEVHVFPLISVYCYTVGKQLIFPINIPYINLLCCNFNSSLLSVSLNTCTCICTVKLMLANYLSPISRKRLTKLPHYDLLCLICRCMLISYPMIP